MHTSASKGKPGEGDIKHMVSPYSATVTRKQHRGETVSENKNF